MPKPYDRERVVLAFSDNEPSLSPLAHLPGYLRIWIEIVYSWTHYIGEIHYRLLFLKTVRFEQRLRRAYPSSSLQFRLLDVKCSQALPRKAIFHRRSD